ncbi:hypothetical protein D3C72_952680 [compost metagenome]
MGWPASNPIACPAANKASSSSPSFISTAARARYPAAERGDASKCPIKRSLAVGHWPWWMAWVAASRATGGASSRSLRPAETMGRLSPARAAESSASACLGNASVRPGRMARSNARPSAARHCAKSSAASSALPRRNRRRPRSK